MCKALPDDKAPVRGKVPNRAEYVVADSTSIAETAEQVSIPLQYNTVQYSAVKALRCSVLDKSKCFPLYVGVRMVWWDIFAMFTVGHA